MNITIITNKDDLAKAIDSIATRGKKLDHDIHVAAVSCLSHLGQHGDIGMVNRLYAALPKGARKAAMTSWLLAYGSLEANTAEDKGVKPFVYAKAKSTNVEGGMADPWYDHKADPAPDEVFDVQKALEGIIRKAKDKELVHGEFLTAIEALLAGDNKTEVLATEGEETKPE